MAKLIGVISLVAVVLAAAVLSRSERNLQIFVAGDEASARNLLLYAAGVRNPGPGQVRIPIPGDPTYEVIVIKPGTPKLVAINANP